MKYVYILRNGVEYYKVGMTMNVVSRMAALQTANPEKIELVCFRLVSNAQVVESKLHKFLVQHKSGGGQEWFRLQPEQAIDLCIMLNHEPEMQLLALDTKSETLLAAMQSERRQLFDAVNALHQRLPPKNAQPKIKVIDDAVEQRIKHDIEKLAPKPTMDQYEVMAMEIFRKDGRASASLLQRRLSIGYAKAARIVDNLEEKGLVSSPSSSSPVGRAVVG